MSQIQSDSAETARLLDEVSRGDRRTLEQLLAHYRPELLSFVKARLDPRVTGRLDPSDVVQEAQLEVVRRMDDFLRRRPMPFRVWVRKAAYQRLLDFHRHHLKRGKRAATREVSLPGRSSLLLARPLLHGGPSPSQQLAAREFAERVAEAVAGLSEADREVLLMRHGEGLPFEEIAILLDIEAAAARKRFGRALIRLQKALADHGLLGGAAMSDMQLKAECELDSLVGRVADEFLRRQEAGERPDVEEYVARHPEAADLLRKVLASLRVLDHSLAGAAEVPGEAGAVGTLGDYRIIREVGRGGMGIVYEAEQVSLGRRVALKVLPFAATMDPRHLQRFHNEARAAAGLHHTNIVPVYGVGSERGVHYYAMQFIDGRTLADVIAQPRGVPSADVPTTAETPAAASAPTAPPAAQTTSAAPRDVAYFRQVAEWGVQAAEALDCAHQMGVVHRDVKPANLLVDAVGRLWVTDFGLAQVQSDTRLTMTGDLVGTLRYMSPEQALAKRVVIDHRTDIYSLGATLYELLTLQPAFTGSDGQELLRQIAFEEPTRLRRINKATSRAGTSARSTGNNPGPTSTSRACARPRPGGPVDGRGRQTGAWRKRCAGGRQTHGTGHEGALRL
jgi:RNA polymerase sigma-70 factor (subfamily 1)